MFPANLSPPIAGVGADGRVGKLKLLVVLQTEIVVNATLRINLCKGCPISKETVCCSQWLHVRVALLDAAITLSYRC